MAASQRSSRRPSDDGTRRLRRSRGRHQRRRSAADGTAAPGPNRRRAVCGSVADRSAAAARHSRHPPPCRAREPWPRQGNHHPDMAPHGVYPCAGEDRWIVIQVDSEAAWRSLQAIAAPALDGFGSRDDRTRRRPELDSALANWTATRDNGELMQTLQQAGVCAARVSDATEVLFDPHFDARGFWQWRERAVVGLQPNPSAPWRPRTAGASQPFALRQVAPTLGQHNDDVLHGVLGLSAERLTELRAEGVIGQVPRMPGSRVRANPG
ncbi:MAG: CoA transferase [Pseudomonadales bacterium]